MTKAMAKPKAAVKINKKYGKLAMKKQAGKIKENKKDKEPNRLTKAALAKSGKMTLDDKMSLFANGGKTPQLTLDEWRAVNGRFKTAVKSADPEVQEQWKGAEQGEQKNKTKRSLMIGWLTDGKSFGAVYHSFVKQLNISRKVTKKEKWQGRKAAQTAGGYDTDEFDELVEVGAIARRPHPKCAKIIQYCDMHDYEKVSEVDRRQSVTQSGRKNLDALADQEVQDFEKGFKTMGQQSDEQLASMDIDALIASLTGEEMQLPVVELLGAKAKKALKDGPKPNKVPKDDDEPKTEDKVDNTDKALAKCKAMLSLLTQKCTAVESFQPSLKGASVQGLPDRFYLQPGQGFRVSWRWDSWRCRGFWLQQLPVGLRYTSRLQATRTCRTLRSSM